VPYEQVYGSMFEDMRRRVPDLAKIRRAVGYQPEVRLDQLLEMTIRETCEQLGHPFPAGLATA
jgi:UDP-glucose 4-epimerase